MLYMIPTIKLNEREIQMESLRNMISNAMDANNKGIRSRQIDLMAQMILLFKENDFDYTAAELGRMLKLKYYMYRVYAALGHLQDLGIVRFYRKISRVDTYQLVSWKPDYVSNNNEYENYLKSRTKIRELIKI